MTTAVLSIGSNVGDSVAHLRSVVAALGARLRAASGVYRTAPWGGIEQAPFHNAVLIAADPDWTARDWLAFGRSCEAAAHRTRDVRWGPRTLDVDVIVVQDAAGDPVVTDDPELTLPHPRAHERAFVLAPWAEVQPDAVLPQGSVADLACRLQRDGAADQRVVRLDEALR